MHVEQQIRVPDDPARVAAGADRFK